MNINDTNAVSEIKALALDMINKAKYGYPGIVLSAAPILYVLYAHHMQINPENPKWINRDRFVLASSHAASLLYATLHLCGFNIKKEDLKNFSSLDSICPVYPDSSLTPGVDFTTGLTGEGIATAVGIALGERYIENTFKSLEYDPLIDFNTYCLLTENDLMEGVAYEALSFAGCQKLNKLIFLCDYTHVTNDGSSDITFNEDLEGRLLSMGLNVINVKDGSDLKAIDKALKSAKKSKLPSIILFNTVLGTGSRNEGKSVVYNTPLGDDDVFAIKRKLNVTVAPFDVRKDTIVHVNNLISNRVGPKYNNFVNLFNKMRNSGDNEVLELLRMLVNNYLNIPFESLSYRVNDQFREDLRLTNAKILNLVASKSKFLLGGSTDQATTTKAYLDNTHIQTPTNPLGRNINFGTREHAASCILNGMASLGLKVYNSTKLVYSDYQKSAMRTSALMNLPVTYIYTNDSIKNSMDGPLLEPVEQLSNLRSIPNMIVFRPSDFNELLGCWEFICKSKKCVSLIISDEVMPKIPTTNAKLVFKGAYIVSKETTRLDGILLTTGPEIALAIKLKEELKNENLDLRIVSMPSKELFKIQDKTYQNQILPRNVKTIVLEPSLKSGWTDITFPEYIIGLNDFGYSGKKEEVLKKINLDYESIKLKVTKIFFQS